VIRAGWVGLRALAAGPAWPLAAAGAAAWLALAAAEGFSADLPLCRSARSALVAATVDAVFPMTGSVGAGTLTAGWLVMLMAMMLPLLGPAVSRVWSRSLAHRRPRALTLFLAGYFAVWTGVCAVLSGAVAFGRLDGAWTELRTPVLFAGVAILWQGSAAKRRFLNRCHVVPSLPAFGLSADVASLRFGLRSALACAGSCWGLMAFTLVSGRAHLAAMAAVSAVMLVERFAAPRPVRSDRRMIAAGLVIVLGALLPAAL